MTQVPTVEQPPSAAELRASAARFNLHRYQIAARAGVNASALSGYLTGRIPLDPEMAARIATAIADLAAGTAQ